MNPNLPRHITPRFPFLNLAALLLKNLAFLVIGVGIAVFLYSLYQVFTTRGFSMLGVSLIMLFWFLVTALFMMIAAEMIHVFLAIEENTRRTADALTGERTGTTPRVAD